MPLTRDVKEIVQARAERDPALQEGLLKEGVERLLAREVDTGKTVLRSYINATIGGRSYTWQEKKPSVQLSQKDMARLPALI